MLESLKVNKSSNKQHIMLFDLATGGHHLSYIQYIIRYCFDQEFVGKLDIVVSPKFLEEHSDIVKLVSNHHQKNVEFLAITEAEYSAIISYNHSISRVFKEWSLSGKYAQKLEVQHCLFMYLDSLQLPMALRAKFPCPFSGIYFRPTLHYKDFNKYTPSAQEQIKQWQKKTLLYFAMQNPQLKILFCLDPFAIPEINKLTHQTKIIYLPDPVEIHDVNQFQIKDLKMRLKIDSQREVLLFFGRLGRRKGIYQLIEAVKLLSIDICERICLLLAGSIPASEKLMIEMLLKEVSESSPIQIVVCDRFIPDEEVHIYFQMADAVLAPYQRHIGMSGILLLAAAAQKPVLSSNYGLMGQLVLNNKLGITVDSTSPHALAKEITKLLDGNYKKVCDISQMESFAQQHSWKQFVGTLISNLC
ncbi:glycosyltransferase [Merismopedia glauca]|uniref:Glycosyl transferase family 1 n=1 Tax=Merismopedia glauca CCAP 1448/3 TaxID=1296344 RepID=A0A2T1C758_9CYAN|nr:glycosyltransferase [Merismopedia glauca]PSB04089.1 glycosyl transferase family 1 [Merismopedia glauca CCAP 1448/3]